MAGMPKRLPLMAAIVAAAVGGYFLFTTYRPSSLRAAKVFAWLRDPASHPEWKMLAGTRCGEAPLLFPTDGLIGFLWGDSFRPGHKHQGLDIFAGSDVGVTPVFAAYDGYLTRLPEWKSAVIVRVPQDPLTPGRQIWLYYTHMADAAGASYISQEFPPGTREQFVSAGTFLGYQGNYSGDPGNPVGVHLHFSIVLDDGSGRFRNELDIENTLDPTPYFGFELHAARAGDDIPRCRP